MDSSKIIYVPTIKEEKVGRKITKQVKKYEGFSIFETELLILTGKISRFEKKATEYLILSADQEEAVAIEPPKDGTKNIFYYSQFAYNNLLIYAQRKCRQPVIYTADNNLILFEGENDLPLVSISELDFRQVKCLSWAMITIAAGFIAGLPFHSIRKLTKNINFKGLSIKC